MTPIKLGCLFLLKVELNGHIEFMGVTPDYQTTSYKDMGFQSSPLKIIRNHQNIPGMFLIENTVPQKCFREN